MPHILIDYTANLQALVDERELVDTLHRAAVQSGIFPVWGIRTFARPVPHCRVGNGDPANGFIQVVVRIGPGRDLPLRQRIAALLFDALLAAAGDSFEGRRLACQLEVMEFDPALTLFQNNLADGADTSAVLRRFPAPEQGVNG